MYYRYKLPHIQIAEATYFITYRLANSVPMSKINELREEKLFEKTSILQSEDSETIKSEKLAELDWLYFQKGDVYADTSLNEPYWLKNEIVAQCIMDSWFYLSQKDIHLNALCVMPNHVHVVLSLQNNNEVLHKIMQRHKSFTANCCIKTLQLNSQIWERESYDHIIRHGKFNTIVNYVINNPVKAGFVKDWKEWKFTYLQDGL